METLGDRTLTGKTQGLEKAKRPQNGKTIGPWRERGEIRNPRQGDTLKRAPENSGVNPPEPSGRKSSL